MFDEAKHGARREQDTDLDAGDLREVAAELQGWCARTPASRSRPTATSSSSWPSRPSSTRGWASAPSTTASTSKIPHDLGTAVNVVTMVFGNMGDDSGTGVAFTRDPTTGEQAVRRVPAQRPGRGRRGRHSDAAAIAQMREACPTVYGQFEEIADRLEKHYRDVQDLEFTVERGKLYMLQTRNAKRTARGRREDRRRDGARGHHPKEEALKRVEPARSSSCCVPQFDPAAREARHAHRQGPHRLTGRGRRQAVFDPDTAASGRARASRSSWCARDLARGLPRHGRRPGHPDLARRHDRHAAVVARQMGKPCVAGRGADRRRRAPTPHAPTESARAQRRRLDLARRHDRRGLRRRRSPRSARRLEDERAADASGLGRRGPRTGRVGQRGHARARPRARGSSAPTASACAAPSTCSARRSGRDRRSAILVADDASRAKDATRRRDARADDRHAVASSTPLWPISRSSRRATSTASSRRWTACRSSSG